MKVLKSIFHYFLWLLLSLVVGIIYMRLLLGEIPNKGSYDSFGIFLNLFYTYGILYIGLILGTIIAVLFISIDFLILRKKLNTNKNSLLIRISTLLLITIIVGIVHSILEKNIDLI